MKNPPRWTNDELDVKVLEILGVENKRFGQLCEILGVDPMGFNTSYFREIDRCLQRLKKARRVRFNHKDGWQLCVAKSAKGRK